MTSWLRKMIRFSLSKAPGKVAPEEMALPDGRVLAVNADFRCILKCLRTLKNPKFTHAQKEALIALYFFRGALVENPSEMLGAFLDEGESEEDHDNPVMDFEQDADVIYASFLREYGMDLMDVGYLHWAKFKALLAGLSAESPLGRRIHLREMDTSKMDPKDRAKAERLKQRVQLEAEPMTAEEKQLHEALDRALASGENPAAAILALKQHYTRTGGGNDG